MDREVSPHRSVTVAIIAHAEAAGLVRIGGLDESDSGIAVAADSEFGIAVTDKGAAWLEERGRDPLDPNSAIVFMALYGEHIGVPLVPSQALSDIEHLAADYRRGNGA